MCWTILPERWQTLDAEFLTISDYRKKMRRQEPKSLYVNANVIDARNSKLVLELLNLAE